MNKCTNQTINSNTLWIVHVLCLHRGRSEDRILFVNLRHLKDLVITPAFNPCLRVVPITRKISIPSNGDKSGSSLPYKAFLLLAQIYKFRVLFYNCSIFVRGFFFLLLFQNLIFRHSIISCENLVIRAQCTQKIMLRSLDINCF